VSLRFGFRPGIVDAVPMGTSAADAMQHIRLVIQLNDWSLRTLAGPEMKTGFGWVQAKPPCSVAPYACTRNLVAGTVIGSGTVSNENFREVGSSCIAERRGIEIVDTGTATTEFMRFGDRVRMQGTLADGRAPFGVIDQQVARA
jgi:fumarylacetoacetate (FAA) hydrolase